MLKLDLLVPVILIVCLIALAYILSKVFTSEVQDPNGGKQTEIVLDPDRYREDDGSLGSATNYPDNESDQPAENVSNSPSATSDAQNVDSYFQDGSEGNVSGGESADPNEDDRYYDEDAGASAAPTTTTTVQTPPSTPTTTTRDIRRGEYHVIAGSFRQKRWAQERIKDLKRSGFPDAYLGYTNRGTYAVAVAGSSTSESEARALASRLRTKGYDSFVKRGE